MRHDLSKLEHHPETLKGRVAELSRAGRTQKTRRFLRAGKQIAVRLAIVLPALALQGCPPTQPPPPANFGITIQTQNNQLGGYININGTGFSANGSVNITYQKIPNRPPSVSGPFMHVDGSGNFSLTDSVTCTSTNPADAFVDVYVYAKDANSGNVAIASIKATPWVCPPKG